MTFTSILDLIDCDGQDRIRPSIWIDLNLDKIFEQIQYHCAKDIKELYRYFPRTEECESYRRAVFADIKQEKVYKAMTGYVNQMHKSREAANNKENVEYVMQQAVWHLLEVYHYFSAFDKLCKLLQSQTLNSKGLIAFKDYLETYLNSVEIVQMKQQAYELVEKLEGYKLVLTIENDTMTLSQGELEGSFESFLKENFPEADVRFRSPFAGSLDLSNLEKDLLEILNKKESDFFKAVNVFHKEYSKYADETLLRFDREIDFYLAYYEFQQKMIGEGFEFTTPFTDKNKEIHAYGLYDLALACQNYKIKKEVVSNDMVYHDGELMFVVTGPNQGGKTTFARSLGQLIYFTKLGLDVPAVDANVHYFSNILTHFSVEESVDTGRGKLKEELDRLAPMMGEIYENAFVIINELFTTAANYDACIMGKKVIEHFVGMNCHGVYVTHLKELSEGHSQVVSMKALVETKVDDSRNKGRQRRVNIRKYKVERFPADDMGYSEDLVEKHKLFYEDIKARLS